MKNSARKRARLRRFWTFAAFTVTGLAGFIFAVERYGANVNATRTKAQSVTLQDTATTPQPIAMTLLTEPTPISTRQKPVSRTEKPVTYSAPMKKAAAADEAGVCPTCKRFHLKSVTCASDAAFISAVVKEPVKAVKKTAKATPAKKEKANAASLTFVRTWQAADNTPRAGRTVGAKKLGDIGQMSDLEKEAASSEKMWRQLEEETQKIRNPPVWESGVLKFIKGQ